MIHKASKLPLWCLKAAVKLTGRSTGVDTKLKQSIKEHGCIFIHIPKCAGNAVQKSLFGEIVFGHQTIRQYQLALPASVYRKAWKFTVTRDPWERLASAWQFLKSGGLHAHDAKYFTENISQYSTFDHFVNDWLVYQDLKNCGCVHFKPQVHFIQDLSGVLALDQMIKLSNLGRDYSSLKERFMGGGLVVENKAKESSKSYSEMLASAETRLNIAKVYAEDITALNYKEDSVHAI
jgi:hypothetical protein